MARTRKAAGQPAALAGAMLLIALFIGCSGKGDAGADASSSSAEPPVGSSSMPPGSASAESSDMAADDADDEADTDDMTEAAESFAEGYPGGPPGEYPGAPAVPKRPQDVSQWKPEDYKSALADGDPLFETAVAQLGAKKGDAEAAGLLVSLLNELGKAPERGTNAGGEGVSGSGPPPGYGPPAGSGPPPGYGPPGSGPPAGYAPSAGPGPSGGHGAPPGSGPPATTGPMGPMSRPTTPTGRPGTPAGGHGASPMPPRGPAAGQGAPMSWNNSSSGNGPAWRESDPPPRSRFPASPLTVIAAAAVGWQNAAPQPAGHAAQSPRGSAGFRGEPAEPAEMPDPAYDADGGYPGYGESGFPGSTGQAGQVAREVLFKAILKALVANDTPQAWQSIEGLLKGEIKTGLDDKLVVDEVLAILLANYRGAEHATGRLLNLSLTAPERLRPADGAAQAVSATDLRQRVLDLHTTSAASAIDALLGVPTDQTGQSGRGSRPGGYGALSGYGAYAEMEDSGIDPAEFSAPGPGGGPAQNAPAAAPVKIEVRQVSPEEARRMLEYLGQPALLGALEAQIRNLPSLTDPAAGAQLALAASLPAASLRTAQYELLQAHWNAGADGLMGQKLFEQGPRDPGFLVVLKSIPLLKTLPLRQPPTPRAQQENQAKHSWATAVRQLVRTLNARFHAAAQARSGAAAAPPPLRLHQGATVSAEYRLAWPEDAGGNVPASFSEPFIVHYVRIDAGQVNPQQILLHYERQIRGGKAAYALNNFEAWIEHEGAAEDPTRRVSTDVMLTIGQGGAGGGQGGGGERTQNVVVEILSIEIPSPRPSTKDVAQKEPAA